MFLGLPWIASKTLTQELGESPTVARDCAESCSKPTILRKENYSSRLYSVGLPQLSLKHEHQPLALLQFLACRMRRSWARRACSTGTLNKSYKPSNAMASTSESQQESNSISTSHKL